jgi:hypothetical protein
VAPGIEVADDFQAMSAPALRCGRILNRAGNHFEEVHGDAILPPSQN